MAAVAGRGHLRTSHVDRERAMEMLKAAFVQGRLTKDEFDLRVGQALASRTYAELDSSGFTGRRARDYGTKAWPA
jgi:hypothetical protein